MRCIRDLYLAGGGVTAWAPADATHTVQLARSRSLLSSLGLTIPVLEARPVYRPRTPRPFRAPPAT